MAEKPEPAPSQPEVLRLLLAQRPFLLAFITALVRDLTLAERIFEDLCVSVSQRPAAAPLDTTFGAWAREQARLRTLASLGARAQEGVALPSAKLVDELERAAAELSGAGVEGARRRKEALRAAFTSLPAHLRQTLERRYAESLTGDALAAKLGQTRGGMSALLDRARQEIGVAAQRRLAAEGGAA